MFIFAICTISFPKWLAFEIDILIWVDPTDTLIFVSLVAVFITRLISKYLAPNLLKVSLSSYFVVIFFYMKCRYLCSVLQNNVQLEILTVCLCVLWVWDTKGKTWAVRPSEQGNKQANTWVLIVNNINS